MNAFSLDPYAGSALRKTTSVPLSTFTVQTVEGLPGIDAAAGIEAVWRRASPNPSLFCVKNIQRLTLQFCSMAPIVATFGEVMLRLTPPGFERFLQSPQFMATFGGAEANVAVSLAQFGEASRFITVLPDRNFLADALVGELRRYGVDASHIVRGPGRLGVYFVEAGANQRPPECSTTGRAAPSPLRNRARLNGSARSKARPGFIDRHYACHQRLSRRARFGRTASGPCNGNPDVVRSQLPKESLEMG